MSEPCSKRINPKQREFFNERAEIWDTITTHDAEKVAYIVSLLGLKGDERIMDVGTGTGVMIPFYEEKLTSGSILAVDYSEKMIEVAKKKFPEQEHPVVFQVADIYNLQLKPEFDLIICYSCFPHFPNQPLAVSHLATGLKAGGKLVVAHSASRDHINNVHVEAGKVVSTDFLPPMAELVVMMTAAGLQPVFQRDDEEYYVSIAFRP
ncbi:class I SAM-dependent methyltransferase [Candidatus Methanomassiliicoccus intestinalis]|uniref:class I SAM-dependent methyltransferase n=1 Tax=Candidatus Methanomassiliicoccus intestinalis TaxID=1406512 RepID=UPI0037DC632E